MTLRLVPRDLALATLDTLEVDAAAAFVGAERPLAGLAGLIDWRLCGALSRAILAGTFSPEKGEVLLVPSGGRLPIPRIFCFGVAAGEATEDLARRASSVLAKAGVRSLALALSPGSAGSSLTRAFVQAGVREGFLRHVFLGSDPRALARELEAAVRDLRVDAAVEPPAPRGEGRGAASLPPKGPVVG